VAPAVAAQGTRLLRQPTISQTHIVFAHGGDLWVVDRGGGDARRLTSTPAVESDPHFSPDGRQVAFSSNRSGGSWLTENEGVPPDIEVWMDARAVAECRDPQLERAVQEVMSRLGAPGSNVITPPPFSRPSRRPGR
jgi:tricorn protease